MIIADLWRYGNWWHVATGCNALVLKMCTSAWQGTVREQHDDRCAVCTLRPVSGNADGSWGRGAGRRLWLHWSVPAVSVGRRHRPHLQRHDAPAHQQAGGPRRRNIQGDVWHSTDTHTLETPCNGRRILSAEKIYLLKLSESSQYLERLSVLSQERRASPKWPTLCRVGCKSLTQSTPGEVGLPKTNH